MANNLETVRESQEQPPKIFLEVGTRYSPVLLVGKRRLSVDERYVGIDLNMEDLKTGKSAARVAQPEASDRMLFINADGRQLPLADGSIHEVLLNNVLGDPRTDDRELLISQLHRVLADRGVLIIAEMYTPDVAPDGPVTDYCQKNGFELRRLTKPHDSDWNERAGLYGSLGAMRPDMSSYVAEFVKTSTP